MERIEFDLLFRWFVSLGVDDPVWDATTFTSQCRRGHKARSGRGELRPPGREGIIKTGRSVSTLPSWCACLRIGTASTRQILAVVRAPCERQDSASSATLTPYRRARPGWHRQETRPGSGWWWMVAASPNGGASPRQSIARGGASSGIAPVLRASAQCWLSRVLLQTLKRDVRGGGILEFSRQSEKGWRRRPSAPACRGR